MKNKTTVDKIVYTLFLLALIAMLFSACGGQSGNWKDIPGTNGTWQYTEVNGMICVNPKLGSGISCNFAEWKGLDN